MAVPPPPPTPPPPPPLSPKRETSNENNEATNEPGSSETTPVPDFAHSSSMTTSLFIYWVVPVFFIALFSRFTVDTHIPPIPVKAKSRPVDIKFDKSRETREAARHEEPTPVPAPRPTPRREEPPELPAHWPTAYKDVLNTINGRRRGPQRVASGRQPPSAATRTEPTSAKTTTDAPPVVPTQASKIYDQGRGASTDPVRAKMIQQIDMLREDYLKNDGDVMKAIAFADAMRMYDIQYHDGGTYEMEAMGVYDRVVEMAVAQRQNLLDEGKPTDVSSSGSTNVNDEVTVAYPSKSADGLLCAVYTAQGKLYYMANMFERSVESYSNCLKLQPLYLDAANSRGSAYIVLGKYEEASIDFITVVTNDRRRFFLDAFTGLARVLEANEDAVPGGWTPVTEMLDKLIPLFENQLSVQPEGKEVYASALTRLHHVMFTYHDTKTKDFDAAFEHILNSHTHKLSILPPWDTDSELTKVYQTKTIFKPGFWPSGVGSQTEVPIFIIGFVRSGSTLLERVLDAHPMIVGTGENSVFNGRLDDIRNQIVRSSMSGQRHLLNELTRQLAEDVVAEMRRRWEVLDANTEKAADEMAEKPKRFVDKMLTNYHNVGFIHMLYPNALILHVVREPMDTLFSAYKHEFPPGTLDYTSDFSALAELYEAYRDVMDHWDTALPGRVTHIKYEDMVNDMPGVARAIIDATGLPWDESVLDFHKKKHAVNTLSSTQVRKGVYKDGMKSWMRYEKHLKPLVALAGKRVAYELRTTLPGYIPPAPDSQDQ